MMFTLHGHGAGAGIAIGRARVLPAADWHAVREVAIAADAVQGEVARLQNAVQRAAATLQKIRAEWSDDAPQEAAIFLALHTAILSDPALLTGAAEEIRARNINAEAGLARYAEKLDASFAALDDPYLRGKANDAAQVIRRVQSELQGGDDDDASGVEAGEIVVANDLTPADAVQLKRRQIAAFVTALGGPISHTAILARSLGIPAIVGLHAGIGYLRDGERLIVDGRRGAVLVAPDADAVRAYKRRRKKIRRRIEALDSLRDAAAVTLDGVKVALTVNIEQPAEAGEGMARGAAGVGLYRTEFLFMNRETPPDEEEQFAVYADVVRRTGAPVTIRTLDLGADKSTATDAAAATAAAGKSSMLNPALGRRAIRLCLHDLALFKPQLRAIYRASALGEVRLLLPMLSNMDELNQLFALLARVKKELADEGHAFDAEAPVGGMIEVPAAAIAADLFAAKLDFLSIGTNDLIQYTLAIDRVDDEVNYLYEPLHPAVLRLIKCTIAAGAAAKIPVSLCGEMAGNPTYTRILLGLGLREFSMDAVSLLEVKREIRLSDVSALTREVEGWLGGGSPPPRHQLK